MSISDTIKAIDLVIEALASNPGLASDSERQKLLVASKKLQAASESPLDMVFSITLGYNKATAIRVAMEMSLFNALSDVQDGGISAIGLGEKTNADPLLITRLMRFLVAMGFAKELSEDLYVPTPKTGFFVDGSPLRNLITHFAVHTRVLVRLADYFREKGFRITEDAYEDGPFQFAMDTQLNYFDWLKNDREQQVAFNALMAMSRMERGEEWFDFFPTESRFGGVAADAPLLVDIGGGLGHDLAAFQSRFPTLSGKLILQDLPATIDDIKELSPEIERMKYDFFTPQPVKGALAYYLRTILHDWPDKQALEILRHVRDAMAKDSVLLVNENFLPTQNVPLYNAELDLNMLATHAGAERTEAQWRALLEKAGFEVVKIWTPNNRLVASATLFEAVRKG